jgi:transposase
MENLLRLYALPYDAGHPVLCFDERPCFLIGDVVAPACMQSGQVKREHYTYTKHGSCCLLAAIEPLTGNRLAHVKPQRTKKEFACFFRELAGLYADAQKIHVVLDNLNTHTFASFYEHLPAEEAYQLMQRFEFHYTPKCASWLNMIEIEFSALSRLCLNRRIPTIQKLESEALAFIENRTNQRVKIDWQFSVEDARQKLGRHYKNVNPQNINNVKI